MNIEQIIELDRKNMSFIMDRFSIQFDPDQRRKSIMQEIEAGAKFHIVKRHERIVSYLEYMPCDDDSYKVLSIQIDPIYRKSFLLRSILKEVYKDLKENEPSRIYSTVHRCNKPSLLLHAKLGFSKTGQTEDRIMFEISGEELLDRLSFLGD